MRKQSKPRPLWNKIRITSTISAVITFAVTRIISLVSSRFDDWGNKMIDKWLITHQGDMISWMLKSPLNLFSTVSIAILLIMAVDWYCQTRKQNQKKKPDDILPLYVDKGRHISVSNDNGDIILYLMVDVVNQSNRKIIELDAHPSIIDQWTEELPDNRTISNGISTTDMKRLRWEDSSYQIELKPGISELKKLKIAVLNCMSQEFEFIHEGVSNKFSHFQQNAIYRIAISFKGKLEGNDPDYKYFDFATEFVSSPQNCILDFLPSAADFPSFPEGLKGKLLPQKAAEQQKQ
jgi:hypothetical protein